MDRAGRGKLSIVVISSVFPWKTHLKIIACVMFGVSSSHSFEAVRPPCAKCGVPAWRPLSFQLSRCMNDEGNCSVSSTRFGCWSCMPSNGGNGFDKDSTGAMLRNGDSLSKKSRNRKHSHSMKVFRVATLSKRRFFRQRMPDMWHNCRDWFIQTCFTSFDLIYLVYGQEWLGTKGLSLLQASFY